MKKLILLLFAFAAVSACSAQQSNKAKQQGPQIRRYWFVLLKSGPDRTQDSATAALLQQGHIANIERLYDEGKIKVAGPFGDAGDWQGIFIFDAASREEVTSLLKTDPSIAAGRLSFEIKEWYTAPIGSFVPGKPKKKLTE